MLPVEILHAFYQALPPYGIQHFANTFEIPFRPVEFIARQTGILQMGTAPDGAVFVITDIINFMLAPGANLNAPDQLLGDYAVLGLLRFRLVINDRVPMRFDSSVVSPNWPAPNSTYGLQTGWSVLNQRFGAQRSGGFAAYARSRSAIVIEVIPDDTPQFITTRAGAHMHGFSIPEATFEEIFRKHK